MIDILYIVLNYLFISIGLIVGCVTFVIVVKVAMPKTLPMDESNRINHIRIIWFAIAKPHRFVNHFAWLRNDEGENVND